MARSGEGGGAAACSGGRRGRRRRGRARGVEAGAAKPRWHGAGAGMAASTVAALAGTTALGDVGLARWGSGRRRQRRRCSGTLSSRGGGSRGTDGGGTKRNKCLGEGRWREEGNIWGGLLSRVKPPPGTKGPFVPGGGFTRDKRGFWAGRENSQPAAHLYSQVDLPHGTKGTRFPLFPPNVMFVFVSFYFSFKIDFYLLIQLIKL